MVVKTLLHGAVAALVLTTFLSGCVSTQFSAITAGPVAVSSLSLSASDGAWNRAPEVLTPWLHKGSEMWTRDGILLDRLILVSDVENGGALFKSTDEALVYPLFNADMLPNEVADLAVASLTKLYGSDTAVELAGLRPYKLGEQRAVMFDLELVSGEMPTRLGRTIAFVSEGRLFSHDLYCCGDSLLREALERGARGHGERAGSYQRLAAACEDFSRRGSRCALRFSGSVSVPRGLAEYLFDIGREAFFKAEVCAPPPGDHVGSSEEILQ